ncbi:hypothetical protein SISSUDRAFT_1110141 [Sistotremastrum suecicum HHB10207 ss-3]|uniref:Uncharacterized protein n=1 Tax=Sistotremastrum suecicum HHB10207 ss-3 TaxID=1314776 RepID=A0A166BZ88_9AGAM|nr:hypothetical protein SISSUDRAFT_1110141 [Sistotremastrum suecicum HHB10207 ss-3]
MIMSSPEVRSFDCDIGRNRSSFSQIDGLQVYIRHSRSGSFASLDEQDKRLAIFQPLRGGSSYKTKISVVIFAPLEKSSGRLSCVWNLVMIDRVDDYASIRRVEMMNRLRILDNPEYCESEITLSDQVNTLPGIAFCEEHARQTKKFDTLARYVTSQYIPHPIAATVQKQELSIFFYPDDANENGLIECIGLLLDAAIGRIEDIPGFAEKIFADSLEVKKSQRGRQRECLDTLILSTQPTSHILCDIQAIKAQFLDNRCPSIIIHKPPRTFFVHSQVIPFAEVVDDVAPYPHINLPDNSLRHHAENYVSPDIKNHAVLLPSPLDQPLT